MTRAFREANWQTCLDSALQLEALWPVDMAGPGPSYLYRMYKAEALIGLGRADEALALYNPANDNPNIGVDGVGPDLTLPLALAINGRLPDEQATAIINAVREWKSPELDPLPTVQNRDWSRDEALAIVYTARAAHYNYEERDKKLREARAALELDPSRTLAALIVGSYLKGTADQLFMAGDKQQARALYVRAEPLLRQAAQQLTGGAGDEVRKRVRKTFDDPHWRQTGLLNPLP